MREIKFRAWYANQEMHYGIAPIDNKYYIFFETQKRNAHDLQINRAISIMQYTGLKDKNGKEIYEGDIARITGGAYWQGYHELDIKGEVVMEYGSFGIREKDGFFNPLLACEPYDGEIHIIGNIYENPELIEGETK